MRSSLIINKLNVNVVLPAVFYRCLKEETPELNIRIWHEGVWVKLTPFISRLRTVEILDTPQKILSVDTELTPWFGCIVWPNICLKLFRRLICCIFQFFCYYIYFRYFLCIVKCTKTYKEIWHSLNSCLSIDQNLQPLSDLLSCFHGTNKHRAA